MITGHVRGRAGDNRVSGVLNQEVGSLRMAVL